MSNFGGQSLPSLESNNDSGRGDHVLKPGSGLIMRPSWTKSDPTIIRPFPCIEGDAFQPTRYSENEYSKWFFECTMVTSFGSPQKSWIASDPEDRNYEVRSNPAVMVYDLAAQVSNGKVRGPQEWALAIKGGQGKSAAVSKPDRTLLVRCAMYEYKGEPKQPVDGMAPNHQTVYMLLKKSAWQSMVRELSVAKKAGGGSVDNVNQKFESGDVVALKDGAFLVFYEIGMIPRGYDAPRAAPAASYGKSKPIGYDCIISKTYRVMPATFTDSEIEMIAKRVANPIRTQLNFPTDEEQVRYVVDSMRGTPAHAGLVVHALRDRYERFLPSDFVNYGNEFLRQVGLMAAMVSNPGYNQQQQQQPVLPTWNMPAAPQPVQVPQPVQAPMAVPAFAYTAAQAPIAEANAAANLNKEELQAQLKELRAKLGTPEPR